MQATSTLRRGSLFRSQQQVRPWPLQASRFNSSTTDSSQLHARSVLRKVATCLKTGVYHSVCTSLFFLPCNSASNVNALFCVHAIARHLMLNMLSTGSPSADRMCLITHILLSWDKQVGSLLLLQRTSRLGLRRTSRPRSECRMERDSPSDRPFHAAVALVSNRA